MLSLIEIPVVCTIIYMKEAKLYNLYWELTKYDPVINYLYDGNVKFGPTKDGKVYLACTVINGFPSIPDADIALAFYNT